MERFRTPEFWLKFAAYALPIGFLLYVLYWNFLPFGYNETFTIQVGSTTDTSGQFHLEPSRDLSERKTAPDGTTYRDLNGLAFAVFEPKAVLKNAKVTVTVEGDGVSLTPLQLDFDPASVKWDNSWDFTSKTPFTDTVTNRNLVGAAFPFDGCMYFDGTSKLELPYSYNQFESGPFYVYVKWRPDSPEGDGQQIIGHYNWELWQNKTSITLQVGRMNNSLGEMYSVKYPIITDRKFFGIEHEALAIYSPSNKGYIALFIDGNFAGLTYISSNVIWSGYNGDKNLNLGWTPHNYQKNPYFKGCVYGIGFKRGNPLEKNQRIDFMWTENPSMNIPIMTQVNSSLKTIVLHVRKK